MRIMYLCQYLVAPNQPGTIRAWMIAKFLGARGNEVNVIASKIDYMTGINVEQAEGESIEELKLPQGVKVTKINTVFNGKTKIKRLLQYIIYCVCSLFYGLRMEQPKVVIASSPPIFTGLVGCWLAKLRKAKFVFEIRDPWPDALIYYGVLRKSILTRFLYWLELYIYKNADLLIALSPGIKRMIVQKGISPDRIMVISNGYDSEIFEKEGELIYPRKKPGTSTKVLYVGSLGIINETEYMMEVVTALKDIPEITFEFIGGGVRRIDMISTARKRNLTNVTFIPPVPKKQIPQIMSTGDLAIFATKAGLYSEIGLHNKIFDYLGIGMPVIGTIEGDLRDLMESAGVGYAVKPGDVAGMVDKIKHLHFNKELAWEMGARGRKFILTYYRRDLLLAEYEEGLKRLTLERQHDRG